MICLLFPSTDTDCFSLCVFFFCGVSVFISNLTIQRQYFPNDDDQIGAAKALMRLMDTYELDTETISTGQLPGQQSLDVTATPGSSLQQSEIKMTTVKATFLKMGDLMLLEGFCSVFVGM